jgi:hypothetical protein
MPVGVTLDRRSYPVHSRTDSPDEHRLSSGREMQTKSYGFSCVLFSQAITSAALRSGGKTG